MYGEGVEGLEEEVFRQVEGMGRMDQGVMGEEAEGPGGGGGGGGGVSVSGGEETEGPGGGGDEAEGPGGGGVMEEWHS